MFCFQITQTNIFQFTCNLLNIVLSLTKITTMNEIKLENEWADAMKIVQQSIPPELVEEFADFVGVSKQTVYNYFNGEVKNIKTAKKIFDNYLPFLENYRP